MQMDRIEADYLLETAFDPRRAAEAMAGEQSSGTFVPVPGETPELKARAAARVEAARRFWTRWSTSRSLPFAATPKARRATWRRARVTLSWPLDNLGPSLPNLLATVAGNLFELKQVSGLRLLDIRLPDAFASAYPGPQFGVAGTRRLAGVERPPADRHHHQAERRLRAGGDGGPGQDAVRSRDRLHQGRRAAVGRARTARSTTACGP